MFNGFKHLVIPVFGLLANLACMLFYIVGPFVVAGMSWKEPFVALGFCRPVGTLRRVLLHDLQQGQGQVDPRDFPAGAQPGGRKGGRIHHQLNTVAWSVRPLVQAAAPAAVWTCAVSLSQRWRTGLPS